MRSEAQEFYSGAERRIVTFLTLGFVLSAAALWYWQGERFALGFVIGSGVASLNLVWLKQIAATFVSRAGRSDKSTGWGLAARFGLRYALIAVFAYGMLTNFPGSVRGFITGLFLPVGAFVCEAVYEAYVALRRGL